MDGDGNADFMVIAEDGSIRMWKNRGIIGTKGSSLYFVDLDGNSSLGLGHFGGAALEFWSPHDPHGSLTWDRPSVPGAEDFHCLHVSIECGKLAWLDT
ncbi:hypothetical protein PENARI_c009G01750 [Penicillium arizonense]|uniref:Uncharacterized protein n=1 Tax=Penicillium arizonense TaxID=1835702 RepID=A0A1F5LIY4_PENAI|nr:hypothetical protein PENARI_c009G01750 [Penicillium arizonense]OGE52980.1 hypothetical protein PENARI_c009G01750 [Penicillium arizonense]